MKNLSLFTFFLLLHLTCFAQVGIGTVTPDNSSILDLTSNSKGLLVPRLTVFPSSPAIGLLVYRTDLSAFYGWDGSSWTQAVFGSSGVTGPAWSITGNTATSPGTNFIGTRDNNDLRFKVNNVNAGYLGQAGSSEATSFGTASSAVYRSTAIGYDAVASGSNASIAIGYKSRSLNQDAISIGDNATAAGNEAIAIGFNSNAANYRTIAIGSSAKTAASNDAIAIGYNAYANSYQGIAIGANAQTASNNSALAIGLNANATGYQSSAFGNGASATAQNSTAIGNGTIASQPNTIILGNGVNVGIGTSSPTSKIQVSGLQYYSSDSQAGIAGLTAGAFYQTDGSGVGVFQYRGVLMVKQ